MEPGKRANSNFPFPGGNGNPAHSGRGNSALKPFVALFVCLLAACTAQAQQYVYVNTTNLLLRDRPDKKYNVFAILNAPCRLAIDKTRKGYDTARLANSRFYHVEYDYYDRQLHRHCFSHGWVEKRYVVTSRSQVTAATGDTAEVFRTAIPPGSRTLKKMNYARFPYPEYKGGEKQFGRETATRRYHTGPRGGCYYINAKGRKQYVDSRFCK